MIFAADFLSRQVYKKTASAIRNRIQQSQARVSLEPVLVRNNPTHPISRAAYLRQSKGRWYTTHSAVNAAIRRFTTATRSSGSEYTRSSFPTSATATAVSRLTTRAPFASTLRPNLTGGAFPRTAGGYSLGAGGQGARYFSHSPAAPAQVVNNVSSAVRAFWLSGQKAQYDGVDSRSGEKKYRAVSALRDETGRKMQALPRSTPGSYVEFKISPTITALGPLAGRKAVSDEQSLESDGLLEALSGDFARALKDLAVVFTDLKRLTALGDLPLSLSNPSSLLVHFPGCDQHTVERLCDEVGISRGVIRQDEDFDASVGAEVALLFPYADSNLPSEVSSDHGQARRDVIDWETMLSPTPVSPGFSKHSDTGLDGYYEDIGAAIKDDKLWQSPSLEGYSSLGESENGDIYFHPNSHIQPAREDVSRYEGVEGIYRFLEECDGALQRH